MKGYGQAWQLSVFFCRLKDIDRVRLEGDIKAEINQKEDQVIILDLGPDEKAARASAQVIGPALPESYGGLVVI